MKRSLRTVGLRGMAAVLCPVLLQAFPAGLEAQDLQRRLGDFEVGDGWIYDDWEAGRALAEKEGKPLFVVFRCVP